VGGTGEKEREREGGTPRGLERGGERERELEIGREGEREREGERGKDRASEGSPAILFTDCGTRESERGKGVRGRGGEEGEVIVTRQSAAQGGDADGDGEIGGGFDAEVAQAPAVHPPRALLCTHTHMRVV
jgi:hypothetical protein